MSDRLILIDKQKIMVGGTALTDDQNSKVKQTIIDSSLHIPDMFVIKLDEIDADDLPGNRATFKLGDALNLFKIGSAVEIGLSDENDSITTIFKGEITALEPEFANNLISLTVRGYDKAHRMHRGTKSKAWVNVTDSDMAQQIAGNYGLSAEVDSTSEVYDHVFQSAQSDFDFLTSRAERIGYVVFTENGTLKFKKQEKPNSADMTLNWNTELISFHPRLTLSEQVNSVTVKGWDVKEKKLISGNKTSSDVNPAIGMGGWGGGSAQSALGNAESFSVRQYVHSQGDAETVAQGLLNSYNGGFIEAEGEAEGVPTLHAGMVIEIAGVGQQFSGKYRVTTVRHEYNTGTYQTRFTIEGARPDLLSDLVSSTKDETMPWGGVVIGIVTNNSDDETKGGVAGGTVKLKYPWMADDQESFWARVVVPGGGAKRGIYFMPEVNDEVLVAFEHGDFSRPYVIGGLYNGKDDPPTGLSDTVSSSKVKTRVIKTRTGHTVTFVDEDGGQEYIEIKDAKENTFIKFDAANKKITMDSKGEIEIHATGDINIKSDANINIEATQNLSYKGMQVKGQGSTQMEMTSPQTKLEGTAQVEVTGATTDVKGSIMVNVQGTIVKIN